MRLAGWIAGMVGKAATGTWGIGIGAAGTLLAKQSQNIMAWVNSIYAHLYIIL